MDIANLFMRYYSFNQNKKLYTLPYNNSIIFTKYNIYKPPCQNKFNLKFYKPFDSKYKKNKSLFELWEDEKKINIQQKDIIGVGMVGLGFIAFIYYYGVKIFYLSSISTNYK